MKSLNIGTMSLRSRIILIFTLFITFNMYSQGNYPQILKIGKDTVIAFSREQTLKITEINEENKSCKQMLSNRDSIIKINHKIINSCENLYNTTIKIDNDYRDILKLKDSQLQTYIENEKELHKEIYKQKMYKNISIIGAGIVFILSYISILSR